MQCVNCQAETSNPKFCNKSCSAIWTNRHYPKRKKKIHWCIRCGEVTLRRRKLCDQCNPPRIGQEGVTAKPIRCSSFTLTKRENLTNDTQRYRKIRYSAMGVAKRTGKLKECFKCGYTLHVETCHIKPIRDYSDEALISEINHPDNLIGLCPTHHWEFDNGHLTLGEISIP